MRFLRRRSAAAPERGEDEAAAFAARCRPVRTPQGRTAHLEHPAAGVLCGWPGANVPADPSLHPCSLCADALSAIRAAIASAGAEASRDHH